MEGFEFQCSCCNEIHKGVPGFGSEAPVYCYNIPESEKGERIELSSDTCILDQEHFFVKGCLELPVKTAEEPFVFSSLVSLSKKTS